MSGEHAAEFRRGWAVLLTSSLALGCGLSGIPYYSLSTFIAPLTAEFGWSPARIAVGATIMTVMQFLLAPVMGRIVDRIGVRKLALPSVALFAVAMAAMALVRESIVTLYAGYALLCVLGAGTMMVAYSRVVCTWFDRARGLALGITMAGSGLAAFIMPLVLSAVIPAYGWRGGYVVCGIAALLPLPLLWKFLHERRVAPRSGEATPRSFGMRASEAVRTRQFWTMAAAAAFLSPAIQVATIHMQPMLREMGVEASAVTSTAALLGIGIICGRFLSGMLLDRFHGPTVGFCLFLIPAVGFLVLWSHSLALAPLAVLLIGISIGVEGDILAYFTTRYFGLRSYAEIFGWIFGVMCITGASGPLIVLAMPDDLGYRPLLLMFAGMIVVAAILLGTLGRYPVWSEDGDISERAASTPP